MAGAIATFALLLALPASSLAATAAPTMLTFPVQKVGTTSGVQTVKVTVTGVLSNSIDGYTITGAAPGDYSVSPGPSETFPFGVGGGSKDYTVTFKPAAVGARTATLTFSTNEMPVPITGSPNPTVMLSGTGTQPAVTLNPASPSLAFGNQETGTPSAGQFFQLTNSGNGPLGVSSIVLAGTDAGAFSVGSCMTAPFTLQPGKSCLVGAVFKPTGSGAKSAQIVVTDDAAGSPRTIPLSGTGFVPDPGPPVAITAPKANEKLRRTKKARKSGKLVRRKVALTFRGSASDPGGLARVELALLNVKSSAGKCTFFDGKRKTQTDSCAALKFFNAKVEGKTFSYVLPAKATVASGKYILFARAVNAKGVTTRTPVFVRLRILS